MNRVRAMIDNLLTLIEAGDAVGIGKVLREADLTPIEKALACLTVTTKMQFQLKSRQELYDKLRVKLIEERGVEEADKLLKGL